MKVRIKDSSVRFRITLKELEVLNAEGSISSLTEQYGDDGRLIGQLVYGVSIDGQAPKSHCTLEPGLVRFDLSEADLELLNDESREGVYVRREVRLPNGRNHRFMAFLEKDRPSSKCDKPEAWIYEDSYGHPLVTRKICSAKITQGFSGEKVST